MSHPIGMMLPGTLGRCTYKTIKPVRKDSSSGMRDTFASYIGLSPSGQVPVLNTVGLVCGSAEAGLPVCLILRVVALEPDHPALTLKGKHSVYVQVIINCTTNHIKKQPGSHQSN